MIVSPRGDRTKKSDIMSSLSYKALLLVYKGLSEIRELATVVPSQFRSATFGDEIWKTICNL